ncbi:MAG: LysR family transcriptional regulator, partial [Amphritea sp.]|nr:LysR family transcriptional regulator [Amphritea sp.]
KLSITLLNRTTRTLNLTQEGEWFYPRATEIMDKLDEIEAHFTEDLNNPSGIIRVDAATPFAIHAIAPLLAGFNELYPNLRVVLESNESIVNLLKSKIDIAIRIGSLEDSTLKAKKIGQTYRRIVASPAYIKEFGMPKNVEDLLQHRCLGFTKPGKLNRWPIYDSNKEQIQVTPSILCDSGETIRHLALEGNGIACLSGFTIFKNLQHAELIPILEKETIEISIPIYAVYYSDKSINTRIRCFIDYLDSHIALF